MTRLTDRELQGLRNDGNEAEQAADEILELRAEVERLRAAPAPVALDVTLKDDAASLLRDMLGSDDDPARIRLLVGDGHSGRGLYVADHDLQSEGAVLLCATAAPAPVAQPLTADDLREPKNGAAWRVVWWNESARLMLPAGSKLDSFRSCKNGTMVFTFKRSAIEATGQEGGAA